MKVLSWREESPPNCIERLVSHAQLLSKNWRYICATRLDSEQVTELYNRFFGPWDVSRVGLDEDTALFPSASIEVYNKAVQRHQEKKHD
jgi:hypothetical protein